MKLNKKKNNNWNNLIYLSTLRKDEIKTVIEAKTKEVEKVTILINFLFCSSSFIYGSTPYR